MRVEDTNESLTSRDDSSCEDFYRIYSESMPLRERKPRAEILALVARPDYKVLLVKRNKVVIGFSIIFAPAEEPFGLLEYMGVDSAHRNSGVGGELFLNSVRAVISDRGNIPMLLEVDSDREPSADRAMRARRKDFYRRLGCLQIDGLHYILPLPGEGPPPEMDLMVYLPEGSPPIRKAQLEGWLRVIYQRVYNCSPDDPRITRMMEPVPDPVMIV
ncbi:MAG TPA: GNAT family N-acetyltransferase [Pyrinomonadaceae bacterium]|nr:GNAT family N-acetyltransferase [Pyrinomonadaceae bacterium]